MDLKLKLVRNKGSVNFTEGKLYCGEEFECFTVEDAIRKDKVYGKTAIPAGTYEVVITMSNRFKKPLPLLLNVPEFEGVRIHSGNSSKDTEGCIIVGAINEKDNDDWVGASKVAMSRLLPKIEDTLEAKNKVWLEIV